MIECVRGERRIKMAKILVAEDDKGLSFTLCEWLQAQAFANDVEVVENGEDAWHHLKFGHYDLVLLDWEMPGLPGIEIVRRFRQSGGITPVLMLTGKSSIEDKEAGLDAGADDYLTKPFHFKELGARLRALLRRPAQVVGETLSFRHVQFERARREVTAHGEKVSLQPMELDVLEHFMLHPGEVISLESLIFKLWDDGGVTTQAVYSSIKRLRKKLDREGDPSIFESVYGRGYCLNPAK